MACTTNIAYWTDVRMGFMTENFLPVYNTAKIRFLLNVTWTDSAEIFFIS